jgi:hypothetical protein
VTVARAVIKLTAIGLAAIGFIAPIPACFHPSYEHVACGPDDRCPGGTSCNPTSGFCEGSGAGPIADAAVSDGPAGSADGGGGGGGLGFVVLYGTLSGGTMISPLPTLHRAVQAPRSGGAFARSTGTAARARG